MQALSSLGIGASIAGVAERVFSTARELGDIGLKAFQKVWPILSDPKKGVPLAILGIKLVEHFAPDPNIVDPIFKFGEWMEKYDPKEILGEEPQIFQINWDVINAAIPDEQCGWGDFICGTRNALRALARGIIGGFAGIGSFIYWALWHLAYYAIKVFLLLGAYLIKYLIVPIAKAVISAVNTVFTLIKKALCTYIQYVAPFITIYRAVSDLSTGKKLYTAVDVVAGIVLPAAVVAQDCGFPSPLTISAPSLPSPIQQPVYTSPPIFRYAYDYYTAYDYASAVLMLRVVSVYDKLTISEGGTGI